MAHAAMLPAESAPQIPAIDRAHLNEMTFGDRALERELLELFDRQSALLMTRMRVAPPAVLAALAHTLKGSAMGIGAKAVAHAAASAEKAAAGSDAAQAAALATLSAAIAAARDEIAVLLAG